MQTKVYKGWLYERDFHGECHDSLCVRGIEGGVYDDVLADAVSDDMYTFGDYLSVRYYISDAERPIEQIEEAYLSRLFGVSDAEFTVICSDITGYLWTNEWLIVGGEHSEWSPSGRRNNEGHDLLAELRANVGKYLWLEITYCREGEVPQVS